MARVLNRLQLPALLLVISFNAAVIWQLVIITSMNEPFRTAPEEDPMFVRFPLSSNWTFASGSSSQTPFHCYDGDALVLHGAADWGYFAALVAEEPYVPVRTTGGKALATLWVMDYRATVAGPYQELVLTFVATLGQQPLEVDCAGDVYCATRLLAFDPRVVMYAAKLWLTEQLPIDYGREILGLDKVAAVASPLPISRPSHLTKAFRFVDQATGALVVEGLVQEDDSLWTQLAELPSVVESLGVLNFCKLLANSYSHTTLIGRPGVALRYPHANPRSSSVVRTDALRFDTKFQRWSEADGHSFRLGDHPDIAATGFTPLLIQRTANMRFVFNSPQN
ncbi:MAG: hypothetical protein Q8P67_06200 [archaeon]|nr:hypothetical protein [archaeon]